MLVADLQKFCEGSETFQICCGGSFEVTCRHMHQQKSAYGAKGPWKVYTDMGAGFNWILTIDFIALLIFCSHELMIITLIWLLF